MSRPRSAGGSSMRPDPDLVNDRPITWNCMEGTATGRGRSDADSTSVRCVCQARGPQFSDWNVSGSSALAAPCGLRENRKDREECWKHAWPQVLDLRSSKFHCLEKANETAAMRRINITPLKSEQSIIGSYAKQHVL